MEKPEYDELNEQARVIIAQIAKLAEKSIVHAMGVVEYADFILKTYARETMTIEHKTIDNQEDEKK